MRKTKPVLHFLPPVFQFLLHLYLHKQHGWKEIILHLSDIASKIFCVPSTPTDLIFSSLNFVASLFVLGTSVTPAK